MKHHLPLTLIALTAVVVLAAIAPAAADTPAAPEAVLMSCTGSITVHRADGTNAAGVFGLPLHAGDEVKTGDGSSAEILFQAGNTLQMGANSNIQIKGQRRAPVEADKEAASAKTPNASGEEAGSFQIAQNFLRLKDSEGTSALSGLRSGERNQDLVAISPSQTKIRTATPTFHWEIADPSTELRLTVYNESGVLWQQDVSGDTSLEYPADAPALTPGVTYSWTLETTDPLAFPPLRTSAAFFEVMDAQDVTSLDEGLTHIADSDQMSETTRHFLRASLYFKNGLLDDAIAETQSALDDDPTNTGLQSILARLYEEAGRSQEAMAIYRKLGKD